MDSAPHKPVLIDEIIANAAPIHGIWLDGTFGAGGYSRALIAAGAEAIIGIDRDPLAHQLAAEWIDDFPIRLHKIPFSQMAEAADRASLDGIVLDIGVSSMQLDIAERGFSFMHDGPLDMRMSQAGKTAADLVNSLDEAEIADILYLYGEERASRRIARAIVAARKIMPLSRTKELADICERALPRKKPHDPHPATRTFQALRIAVNGELDELHAALDAAIPLLRPGGVLVVVTFHSLEDRIVKQFLIKAAGKHANVNRYQPLPSETEAAQLELLTRKPIQAGEDELRVNPRARSAKLRMARRLGGQG